MVSMAGATTSAVVAAHPENAECEERKGEEDLVGMGQETVGWSGVMYL